MLLDTLTFSRILQDILLLLAHACILTVHIFIPEGNYGKFIRVYHPSTLSTVFSLKQYGVQQKVRNPLSGHRVGTFQNQFASPKRGHQGGMDSRSSGGIHDMVTSRLNNRGGTRWSIEDWDEPNPVPEFNNYDGGSNPSYTRSIPSTSSRTKFFGKERSSCCEVPNSVIRALKWFGEFILKSFYIIGALLCLPLIGFSLYLLTRNLFDHEWRTKTIMLIPGFNIALGVEAVMLFISVLSVSLVHEWGHIICATLFEYRVKQFGGMAYGPIWMGVSEIEWTSREDGSSKKIQRDDWKTKIVILLAGIWHNFCVCGLIYLVTIGLWKDRDGVRMLGNDATGTIPETGMRLFRINDGDFLRDKEQYLTQAKVLESSHPLYYCVPQQMDMESIGSCCETKGIIGSQFCFKEITGQYNDICNSIKDFTVRNAPRDDERCYQLKHPRKNWQVISMQVGQYRDMSDLQSILFYGDVGRFLHSIEITDRHLRWGLDEIVPSGISDALYRFMQITFTLTFGLGILNLLPIPMFDGSHVVSTILFEIAKWGGSSRLTQWMVMIHIIFVSACCVLFGLNVLLSLWNAYTLIIM